MLKIELPPLPKASKMYDIPGYDEEELKDYARAAIDAAVAPLAEALEDCIGMLRSFTGSRYDEEGAVAAQISDAEQALAAWRS